MRKNLLGLFMCLLCLISVCAAASAETFSIPCEGVTYNLTFEAPNHDVEVTKASLGTVQGNLNLSFRWVKGELAYLSSSFMMTKTTEASCTEAFQLTREFECDGSLLICTLSREATHAEHSWTEWETTDAEHARKCTNLRCTVQESEAHSGGAATCAKLAVCADCGKAYGVVDENNHNVRVLPAVAPTATEDGLTEGKRCDECSTILVEQEVIPALGVPADLPKTGDESNFVFWCVLAAMSTVGVALIRRRRTEA